MSAARRSPPAPRGRARCAARWSRRSTSLLARRASGVLPGERRAAGLGDGTELAQIRPYQVGDDVRRLDAAASARTGEPHVRDHVPERALTTWILLDISASMAFGTGARLKSDVAAGVAEVVGRLAVRRAGRVALLTCGAPTTTLLPPRGGRRALVALRRAVAAGVAPDGAPRATGSAPACAGSAGSPAAGGSSSWCRTSASPRTGRRPPARARAPATTCSASSSTDPREAELPDAGQLVLADPETGARLEVDSADADAAARVRGRRARPRATRSSRRCGARGRATSSSARPTRTGSARSGGGCDELPGADLPARAGRRPARARRAVACAPARGALRRPLPRAADAGGACCRSARRWRRIVPPALLCLALAGLALALARPETTVAVPVERASVVLVTDTSGLDERHRRRAVAARRGEGRRGAVPRQRAGRAAGRARRLRRRARHGRPRRPRTTTASARRWSA